MKLSKEQKYTKISKIGIALTAIGGTTFIGSILSPFDIEGPLVEIITAVIFATGTIMKSVSSQELKEIRRDLDKYEINRQLPKQRTRK